MKETLILPAALPDIIEEDKNMSKKETLLLQPIRVDFKTTDSKLISSEQQAEKILGEFRNVIIANKNMQVALVFSENCIRFLEVSESYLKKNYITGIKGANQADVVEHMENLTQNPKYLDLQNKIFYLGIPTCYQAGGIGEVPAKFLIFSLAVICCFLGAGKVLVFGWKNQVSGEDYAIGGGVSQKLTKNQYHLIQNVLRALAENPDDLQKIPIHGKKLCAAYKKGRETGDPLDFTRENIQELREHKPMDEIPTFDDVATLAPPMLCVLLPAGPEESESIFNNVFFGSKNNQLTPLKDKSKVSGKASDDKESDSEGELINEEFGTIGEFDPFLITDSDFSLGKGKESNLENDHHPLKLSTAGSSRKRKNPSSLFSEDSAQRQKKENPDGQPSSSSSSSSSSSRVFNF